MLRHPFPVYRMKWENVRGLWDFSDCGEKPLQHWLHIHNTLFADLQQIRHKVVFHFETFALGNTQRSLHCGYERND